MGYLGNFNVQFSFGWIMSKMVWFVCTFSYLNLTIDNGSVWFSSNRTNADCDKCVHTTQTETKTESQECIVNLKSQISTNLMDSQSVDQSILIIIFFIITKTFANSITFQCDSCRETMHKSSIVEQHGGCFSTHLTSLCFSHNIPNNNHYNV